MTTKRRSGRLQLVAAAGMLTGVGYLTIGAGSSQASESETDEPVVFAVEGSRPGERRRIDVGDVIATARQSETAGRCEFDRPIGVEVSMPGGQRGANVVWEFNDHCQAVLISIEVKSVDGEGVGS